MPNSTNLGSQTKPTCKNYDADVKATELLSLAASVLTRNYWKKFTLIMKWPTHQYIAKIWDGSCPYIWFNSVSVNDLLLIRLRESETTVLECSA